MIATCPQMGRLPAGAAGVSSRDGGGVRGVRLPALCLPARACACDRLYAHV